MMICTETNMKLEFASFELMLLLSFVVAVAAAADTFLVLKQISINWPGILNAIIFNDLCRHRNDCKWKVSNVLW